MALVEEIPGKGRGMGMFRQRVRDGLRAGESRAEGPSRPDPGPQASGPRVGGLRHGFWRIVHPDGSVEEGRYVHGLLHGEWVLRDPSGRVAACEAWHFGRAAATATAGCKPAERPDG